MLAPTQPTIANVFAPRTTFDADGAVEGYASLFGEVDHARDMVMPGAFAGTLRSRDIRRIPMLFQHDPSEPIGVWLELREDLRGLHARGRLIPEVARARELLSLIRAGAIDGLSIGFRTVKGRVDPRSRIRRLEAIDLWEISLVTFPLLPGARVRAVKQASTDLRDRLNRESRLRRDEIGKGQKALGLPSRPALVTARARDRRHLHVIAGGAGGPTDAQGLLYVPRCRPGTSRHSGRITTWRQA